MISMSKVIQQPMLVIVSRNSELSTLLKMIVEQIYKIITKTFHNYMCVLIAVCAYDLQIYSYSLANSV